MITEVTVDAAAAATGTNDFKFGLSAAVGDYESENDTTTTAATAGAAADTAAAPTNTAAAVPAATNPADSTTTTAQPQVGFQPPLTLSAPVKSDSVTQKSNTANTEEVQPQPDTAAESKPDPSSEAAKAEQVKTDAEETPQDSQKDVQAAEPATGVTDEELPAPSRKLQSK